MEERTFFKLKINIPDLDKYFPSQEVKSGINPYFAELIVDEKNNFEISIKIYFDYKEYLGEKIMRWNHSNDYNILDRFEVIEINNTKNLISIDFSGFRSKGMTNSSSFFEFDQKFFIIRITGITKIYRNSDKCSSEFYLNQAAFKLIELNYHYSTSWFDEPFKLEPQNNIKDFIKFGKIAFKPEHNFYNSNKYDLDEIKIKKEPKLIISYSNLSEAEIKEHVVALCSLYSFYSGHNISYFLSRIYTEDKLFIEIKDVDNNEIEDEHGIFRWDFSQNPLNLIINVKSSHLIKNLKFVQRIVRRYNYALKTEGETKFMILYNILEQLRNEYIRNKNTQTETSINQLNPNKVIEEYTFNRSKTETDKFIKEKLSEIIDIVDDKHKDLFKNEIRFKVAPIKLLSMTNQFESFFTHIEAEPAKFNLNFIELKTLRDSIFHGKPVYENLKILGNINRYNHLPKFVGTVILKYFGIANLDNIDKINDF